MYRYAQMNGWKTYSPCKTIISSISTFLFKALVRGTVRARFIDAISGAAGLGFIFKTEDFLPTAPTTKSFHPHRILKENTHCNKIYSKKHE